MRSRQSLLVAAFGAALVLGAAAPGALAQDTASRGNNGNSSETAYATGIDMGAVNIGGNVNQAPDQGTSVSVGGDSNLGVNQPNLGRVPVSGDGSFNAPTLGEAATVTDPVVADDTAPPVADAPVAAEEPVLVDDPAGAPTEPAADAAVATGEGEAAAAVGCGAYGDWYDAQIDLENSTDAAFSELLDPDYDGIACEELMAG